MSKVKLNIKITKNPKLKGLFQEAHSQALQGIGLHIQNAVARNTHPVTGVLKNSWNSQTQEWDSGFGTNPTTAPKIILSDEQKIGKPGTKDRVKVGSNLVYAKPYNDRFAVLEITADQENHSLSAIASAPYKRLIGT